MNNFDADPISSIALILPQGDCWENGFPINLCSNPFDQITESRPFTISESDSYIEGDILYLRANGKGFWLTQETIESASELKNDGKQLDLYMARKQKELHGITASTLITFKLNEWGIDVKNLTVNVYVKNEQGNKELKATIKAPSLAT